MTPNNLKKELSSNIVAIITKADDKIPANINIKPLPNIFSFI